MSTAMALTPPTPFRATLLATAAPLLGMLQSETRFAFPGVSSPSQAFNLRARPWTPSLDFK